MDEQQKKRGMTAQEFLDALGQETTTRELSNGLTVEIRKVDIMQIFTKNSATIPSFGDKAKEPGPKDPELVKRATENFNQVIFAASISPRFVPGTEMNPEMNEIGIDHPMLSSGLKAELMAVVLEFNGFSGMAAEFFRLTRGKPVDDSRPGVQKVRKGPARVPKKKALGTRAGRLRGKARPKG
jgi:hypothetical protein